MQYKKTLATAALATSALAAYVPSEPWSTLTPSATYKGGLTNYASTFGIAVEPVASAAASSKAKRDAISQIGDGQIQAATTTKTTKAAVSQINDGQIQAATTTAKATKAAVSQINDGQIQAATKATKAAVSQINDGQIQAATKAPVSQIGDGQIQAATKAAVSQIGDGQIQAATKTAAAVSQIGDGQIQAATKAAVSQIGDGQIQAATKTAAAVSQINDGQIQAATKAAVSQIGDGQAQAATKTATAGASQDTDGQVQNKDSSNPVTNVSCKVDGTLEMSIKDGILTDGKGRVGSIVSNRQFQFDGPPPQAGALYAAGWSITPEGNLALGDQDVFYQCLSGDFYNLYDESIASQCHPVYLQAIDLVAC
ncbi:similar to Saccharomyces cerevisiae YKL163W PIR3 O-glycosylated covalently-bound cell wall protein required for cell wall stability [Maudiozyma barnettii]|uniref:Similar to Saccharomyces cerevisiae YKL163W PIR3 O-glycosylated covalently-bound cell wall protein required for cell wall stability n=1 Tax=Maudiozyma barnettii TaxID=61262 RepID=A0A8H2VFP6_9SACH|nr:uncharacterized protein KABA2_04S10406 [Kazachstania barnettii]CAB4254620.1 similar to Saccharomyces cerevisiae YKL163W PIR3 O-glycosylated covalently-bound cell wall protein required for cell wall stability [Kazachstania barnettii]CAD1782662.1 similar to Saccharomyces cerevisiae YKL163W PIR3 O-glycosylated covalently-bound cell wall protein required for cell wall stability [Kazachstania barnettii]